MRRYLGSRKNLVGMAGALVGVGLHLAGVIGDLWPAAAVALYGASALVAPSDPKPDPPLSEALRQQASDLVAGLRPRDLPDGVHTAITRMTGVLLVVLDRLDHVADRPADRAAAPEQLAAVSVLLREDLPACLATYRTSRDAGELVTQLDIVAGAVDRLAAQVPDVEVQRSQDLTDELRRRYGT